MVAVFEKGNNLATFLVPSLRRVMACEKQVVSLRGHQPSESESPAGGREGQS
jgi:hypothetical protein